MVERDLSGSVLDGRYRLFSLLGAGGMGQVYEGKHLLLDRSVAVKVLPEQLSGDPRFRRRFAREARAASRIAHLNVVQVLDFGESPDGQAYIVMELLEGRDLRHLLRESGRLPWPRARHILLQAVSALKAAHAHDIIHRDIKPGNCYVLDLPHEGLTDVVKVLDFGIAKVLSEFESDGLALVKPLTGTGEIMGTASYMAPEQARGEPLDARSDIYSLGIMAYEMLTGRVPFAGANPLDVISRHLHAQPPPLRRAAPDVLPEVEEIVLRTLAKDPRDRFGSMAELETALLAIPGPALATVRSRVSATSGARWAAVPQGTTGDHRETSGPHGIHQPHRTAEAMATEPEHQGVTPRFGPLRDVRDAQIVRKVRVAGSKDSDGSDEPTKIEAAAPRELAPRPSPDLRLSQAITKPRPKTIPPAAEEVDPVAETMVEPALRKPVAAEERGGARRPRPKSDRQRARASDATSTRKSTSAIPRLLGVVLLLGSGVAIASMTMENPKEGRPAAPTSEEDVRAEPEASIMANHAAKVPDSSTPIIVKPVDPKPEAPAAAIVTEPKEADAAPMPEDASAAPPSEAASEAHLDAPVPSEKAPSKSEKCRALRNKAQDADYMGDDQKVLRLTQRKSCWYPSHGKEHTLLRIEALFEKDRFEECVEIGKQSADPEVQKFVGWCENALTK